MSGYFLYCRNSDCGAYLGSLGADSCPLCGWTAPCECDDSSSNHRGEADAEPVPSFQDRVQPWVLACFGATIASDTKERNHRFLEEAIELVQSLGCTKQDAMMLVDYVYGRPAGDPAQEVGGVMVTLAALCLASGLDMHENGETELERIWTVVEKIRAKQLTKPKDSPLPQPTPALAIPCAYEVEVAGRHGATRIERVTNREGDVSWAVRSHGDCLNTGGEWEAEPMPSNRDAAFLARCRFPSAEAAIAAAGSLS